MPLSPDYIAGLSRSLVELYLDAEQILLERIARAIAADMDAPDWAERKLIQIQLLQRQTIAQVSELTGRSAEEVATAILKAYNRGAAVAEADIADLIGRQASRDSLPPGLPAVEGIVGEAVSGLRVADQRLLRVPDDVFRQVIARTSPQVLLATQTRRQAAQSALNEFADRGVTGFVDRAGRNWALESYAEMATRSATMNAAVQGQTERLVARGFDLVIVSNAPQECSVCRPWEGKVLSLTGTRQVDPGVKVAGTLRQATSAGLFHPNCRHSTSLYIPGTTTTSTRTADPEGDAARQQLRYLERQVRKWKRRGTVALDDPARAQAAAKVREYQSRIRDHVDSTSAKRQPAREQAGAR